MYRLLIYFTLITAFIGCSTSKETIRQTKTATFTTEEAFEDSQKTALNHFIDGSTAESKGDFNQAIEEFNAALRLNPSAAVYYALAKNYYALNKIPAALNNGKKAVLLDPERIDYYELLSDIFTTADQTDSAASILEKIISIDSTNISAYYKLARIYEKTKPLRAIELYTELTSIVGADWNILLRVGELHEKLGNSEQAIKSIEELLTLDPNNAQLQKLLSEMLHKDKQYDKAIAVLDDLLESNPEDADAHERKAQIYIMQNKWEEASKEYDYLVNQPDIPFEGKLRIGITYFAKSLSDTLLLPVAKKFFVKLDKDSSMAVIKMYLGVIELIEKEEQSADKELKKAFELNGNDSQGWVQLGGLLFDNRKYKESAMFMSYCADSFPNDYVVNLIYGLGLAQTEKHTQAKTYLEKAVELSPNDVNALSAYAFTLNQLKDYDNAVKYLNKALTYKPDDVNLLGTLGLIYNSQKKMEESDSTYEKALRLDSMNALVNNNYAYSLSERGIHLERALSMVNLALDADSNNSSYLDTKGWILYQMEDYENAHIYIQKAIDAAGESSVMLDHLGDILFKKGDKTAAMKSWQKAYDLDSSNEDIKHKLNKGEI